MCKKREGVKRKIKREKERGVRGMKREESCESQDPTGQMYVDYRRTLSVVVAVRVGDLWSLRRHEVIAAGKVRAHLRRGGCAANR